MSALISRTHIWTQFDQSELYSFTLGLGLCESYFSHRSVRSQWETGWRWGSIVITRSTRHSLRDTKQLPQIDTLHLDGSELGHLSALLFHSSLTPPRRGGSWRGLNVTRFRFEAIFFRHSGILENKPVPNQFQAAQVWVTWTLFSIWFYGLRFLQQSRSSSHKTLVSVASSIKLGQISSEWCSGSRPEGLSPKPGKVPNLTGLHEEVLTPRQHNLVSGLFHRDLDQDSQALTEVCDTNWGHVHGNRYLSSYSALTFLN